MPPGRALGDAGQAFYRSALVIGLFWRKSIVVRYLPRGRPLYCTRASCDSMHKSSCFPLGTASYRVPKRLQGDTRRRQHFLSSRLAPDPCADTNTLVPPLAMRHTTGDFQPYTVEDGRARRVVALRSTYQAAVRLRPDLHLNLLVAMGAGIWTSTASAPAAFHCFLGKRADTHSSLMVVNQSLRCRGISTAVPS